MMLAVQLDQWMVVRLADCLVDSTVVPLGLLLAERSVDRTVHMMVDLKVDLLVVWLVDHLVSLLVAY